MKASGAWKIGVLWSVLALLAAPAVADSIYTAQAAVPAGLSYYEDIKTSGTAIVDTGYLTDFIVSGSSTRAGGIASQYGVGAHADLYFSWSGSIIDSVGRGKVQTEVIFTGPQTGDLIPVSLNLFVDGGFGGGYNADQFSYRRVRLDISLYTYSAFGVVGEDVIYGVATPVLEGALAPSGLACLATGCLIETPVFLVPANTPVNFVMQLEAKVSTSQGVAQASFENTLYFPLDRSVFNLPEGYSAEMAGLSVYNNRAVVPDDGGSEVPEPGTLALFGGGLAILLLLRRKTEG